MKIVRIEDKLVVVKEDGKVVCADLAEAVRQIMSKKT